MRLHGKLWTWLSERRALRRPVGRQRRSRAACHKPDLPQGNPAYAWRADVTTATLTVALSQRGGVRVISVHRTNLTAQASWRIVVSNAGNVLHDTTQPMTTVAGQAVFVLPAELQCDVVAITIADPDNPDGYLSISLAYVGPLWQPVRNFSTDSSSGFNLGVDEVTALSGAEFPQMRWIQRKASIAHQSYGAAETATLREIQRIAAAGRIFFSSRIQEPRRRRKRSSVA